MLFCVRADCSWCTGPLPCSASDAACVQPPPSCPCLSSRFSFAFFQAAHSVCEQLFSIIFLSEVYLSQEYFNGRATTLSATNNIHVTECNTQNLFCAEQVQNEPLKLFITKAFIKINLKWLPGDLLRHAKVCQNQPVGPDIWKILHAFKLVSTTPATTSCKVLSETEIRLSETSGKVVEEPRLFSWNGPARRKVNRTADTCSPYSEEDYKYDRGKDAQLRGIKKGH